MTDAQKKVIGCGIGALVLMWVIPPWVQPNPGLSLGEFSVPASQRDLGYGPIWDPPQASSIQLGDFTKSVSALSSVSINIPRLALQMVAVVCVAGGAVAVFNAGGKPTDRHGNMADKG